MISADRLNSALSAIGARIDEIIVYDMTDSTNTRAKEYEKEHLSQGKNVLFVANGQSAGRGRMGRSFSSLEDVGIYMSLLLHPTDTPEAATSLTAATAVALTRAIKSVSGLDTGIKWVNDIYFGSRKLAGILAESATTPDGKLAYLVLGMGINVYKTTYPSEISDIAISIEDATGCKISREDLIAHTVHQIISIIESGDYRTVYDEYLARSIVIGQDIEVIGACERYPARAVGITPDFSLVAELAGGEIRTLHSGEISTKIKNT